MPYSSPIEDTQFILENLLPPHNELDTSTIEAVLGEAGKLADNYLAPLNHYGDKNNPILRQDHEVETPKGFSKAFSEIAKGGWIGVASDSTYDGMGLPLRMGAAINEYWHGANMSFALCSLLTQGLIDAFTLVGTEEEKKEYLPKFNSGVWTGTMNLTEPQSGTDLATIRTKADYDGENWRVRGQKIYITYGEHDMSENIIHLVLARTEGAPEGVKGISTFIVPKFLKDKNSSNKDKAFHLKMLVHFIGDLHQPLHIGKAGDRGGNDIKVQWFYKDTNLHAVWDSKMIDGYGMSYTELAISAQKLSKQQLEFIQNGTPVDWMNDSRKLCEEVYTSAEVGENLRYRYSYDYMDTVRLQLQKGGIRLATILNDIFS